MGKFQSSGDLQSQLEDLWNEFEEDEYLLETWADARCSASPDPDMDSFDIFENGFELAAKAAGRDVTFAEFEGTVYFFIGTEEEVLARLDSRAASARADLLDDKVSEICREAREAGATSLQVQAMSSHVHVADVGEFSLADHGDGMAGAIREWLGKIAVENKILKKFVALKATGVMHGADEGCDQLFEREVE